VKWGAGDSYEGGDENRERKGEKRRVEVKGVWGGGGERSVCEKKEGTEWSN